MKIKKVTDTGIKIRLRQAQELAARLPELGAPSTSRQEPDARREAARALVGGEARPIMTPTQIYPGTLASVDPINRFAETTKEDLNVVADITQTTENDFLEIYNQVMTKESDLVGRIKTLRNKLATIDLYRRGPANNKYIVYSFDDTTDLQEGTLTLSEESGHLSLPVVRVTTPPFRDLSFSGNGRPGNNLDRSRARNGDIRALMDADTQTWFEYESFDVRDTEGLTLTVRVDFETPTIVNQIRIDPVNFGTTKWVKIEDIQIAYESLTESVKPEILSGENSLELRLSPASSKYAGMGIFSFRPRRATSVFLKFRQTEAYDILGGQFKRFAIGIKEIEILQVEYAKDGVFTLAEKSFLGPVLGVAAKKSVALAKENEYSLSLEIRVNDETAWEPFAFLEDSQSASEALVGKAVQRVQLKGKLQRNELSVQTQAVGPSKVESRLKEAGAGILRIEKTPETFLEVIETGLGAVGESAPPLFLGRANGLPGVAQTFDCPVPLDIFRSYVEVNGQRWNFVSALGNEDYEGVLYFPTRSSSQIQFGDGTVGKLPPAGAEIYLKIRPEERALFREFEGGFAGELEFQSDKIVGATRVFYRDFERREGVARVGPRGRYFSIDPTHQSLIITALRVNGDNVDLDNLVDFENGALEFAEFGEEDEPRFSVDRTRGRIYLSFPVGDNDPDAELEYTYELRLPIPQKDWSYAPTTNEIIVTSPLFKPKTGEKTIEAQTLSRALTLVGNTWTGEDYTLIRKSVTPINVNGIVGISRTMEAELPFIDGATEFQQAAVEGGSLLGFYSVDYKKATIYLPPQEDIDAADRGFLPGKIAFQYIATEIEYGIGLKLTEGRDYTREGLQIELSPSQSRASTANRRSGKYHVRYDTKESVETASPEMTRYFSPLVKDLTVIGSGADSRFALVEKL